MIKYTRPVWVEIDMDVLAHNCRMIKSCLSEGTEMMAIIKDDAQGHGAVQIGKTLLENGASSFGVAFLSEALPLRAHYPDVPILILGHTPNDLAEDIINNNITQTIYSLDQARHFSEVAKRLDKTFTCHMKIDTGMHRLGMMPCKESVEDIARIMDLPNVYVEGIYTHFAVSDTDKEFTQEQVRRFNYVCKELERMGREIPIKHVSNSSAVMEIPDLNFNMVRVARILYGYYLPAEVADKPFELKKAMSMRTSIIDVREIEPGEGVSYGLAYRPKESAKIATLPLGYADGLTGLGKTHVIVNGVKRPLDIRITMDMSMVDVTGMEAKVGDPVTIFGQDGQEEILLADNIPNVGITALGLLFWSGLRVPKAYFKNGECVRFDDPLLLQSRQVVE